jgi:hypothetical protein
MANKKYHTDYKSTIIVAGVVGFADCPIPHPEYDKLSLGLRVTEANKTKIQNFIKEQAPIAKAEMGLTGTIKSRGGAIEPATDKEGNTLEGQYFVTLKRNASIKGKPQKIPMIGPDKQPLVLEHNLGAGSKVQVKAHLYFSYVQGFFNIRLEPQAVRVLELATAAARLSADDFEDADEDFVESTGETEGASFDEPEEEAMEDFV